MKSITKLKFSYIFLLSIALPVLGASKETSNVKVEMLSVWTNSGDILVQTSPKPDISGLTCTNDYWLMLDKVELGHQEVLSMLLSAQISKIKLTVRAEDNNGHEFCRLSRIITKAN